MRTDYQSYIVGAQDFLVRKLHNATQYGAGTPARCAPCEQRRKAGGSADPGRLDPGMALPANPFYRALEKAGMALA